jgi:hypothetical protein
MRNNQKGVNQASIPVYKHWFGNEMGESLPVFYPVQYCQYLFSDVQSAAHGNIDSPD